MSPTAEHITQSPLLLVASRDWHSSLHLLLALIRHGFCVDVIAPENTLLYRARGIRRLHRGPRDVGATMQFLRQLKGTASPYGHIFITDDPLLQAISKKENRDLYRWAMPEQSKIFPARHFTSKGEIFHWAKSNNIPVPPFKVIESLSNIDALHQEISKHLIFKPIDGYGGVGIFELEQCNPVQTPPKTITQPTLAHKFIVGKTGICQCAYGKGRLHLFIPHRKLAAYPAPYGGSSIRQVVEDKDLGSKLKIIAERIARTSQYCGFSAFDWVQDEHSKEVYVLDFHFSQISHIEISHYWQIDLTVVIKQMLGPTTTRTTCHMISKSCSSHKEPIPLFPFSLEQQLKTRNYASALSISCNPWTWRMIKQLNLSHAPAIIKNLIRAIFIGLKKER